MDRPDYINEYIDDNKKYNFYKKKLEIGRSKVIDYLKFNPFEDIYCTVKRGKPQFNQEKLFLWLETKLPKKTLLWLLKHIVDEEKLSELYESGKIKLADIPLDCYDIPDNTAIINIPANRKKS